MKQKRVRFKPNRLVIWLTSIAVISIVLFSSINNAVGQATETKQGLEIVAEFSLEHPPGNIAVTPQARLIMSQHQFFGAPLRVVEVMPDGSVEPFPNEEWSSQPNAAGVGLHTVLGLRSDSNGVVWMLDRSPGEGQPGKLLAWDAVNDRLHRVIYLPQPIIADNSFLNDLAVDLEHEAIYITDTAGGDNSALIVVDLSTGFARRVLEGDKSTRPEDVRMVIDDRLITMGDEPAKIGVNPITIDPDNQWVYYGPMSGTSLYRIATADLLDKSLTPAALSSKVRRYGDKPICDGITIDGAGNVYLTSITDHAIGVVDSSGEYRILYQDDKLLNWTDGMAFSDDNFIYVTVSQLQNSPPLNNGENTARPPFYLVKFPSLAPGKVGR